MDNVIFIEPKGKAKVVHPHTSLRKKVKWAVAVLLTLFLVVGTAFFSVAASETGLISEREQFQRQ